MIIFKIIHFQKHIDKRVANYAWFHLRRNRLSAVFKLHSNTIFRFCSCSAYQWRSSQLLAVQQPQLAYEIKIR
jgi:hypothetical protein